MLSPDQWKLWQQLANTLNRDQQLWLSGYISGQVGTAAVQDPHQNAAKLTIYFATETGNSKMVSQQLVKASKQAGWKASAKPVSRVKVEDIAKEDGPVIFVLATHGEGDPPEMAINFYEALKQATQGALKGIKYATLGLGDSSYAEFCGFARKVDAELDRLGAEVLLERKELDVDFASHISNWLETVVKALPSQSVATVSAAAAYDDEPMLATGKGYSRLEPLSGVVTEIVNLNDIGSSKETYHIEIEYSDAVPYAPGDAAGIIIPAQDGEDAITPRLYSIASAPSVHEQSVHLTVSRAWHVDESGAKQYGVCSNYLSALKPGDKIQFYFQQNLMFKLPADDRDIIMIGPGTGIAPFRSFVFERTERGASGRNWLFFGEQHAHCDFLYQQEWIDHVETDQLHRIDLAFSRDQDHKIYVQDRMREKADTLFEWLEDGAYIYVCGSKDPMSHDVDKALHEIVAAKIGEERAADYIADLNEAGRYVKDVY